MKGKEALSISEGRLRQTIRQWAMVGILASGRSRKMTDFFPLMKEYDVGLKTLKRDIEAIAAVPVFEVTTYKRDGETFWRMDGRPWGIQIKPVRKNCTKCGEPRDPDEYYASRTAPDGKRETCRYCIIQYNKEWGDRNRRILNQKARSYRKKNRLVINEKRRIRYAEAKRLRPKKTLPVNAEISL